MSRKFIAAIVAGSIAITGFTTTQSNAADRDLTRFLAGAAALVIIGGALSEENKRRNRQQVITSTPPRYGHQYNSHRRMAPKRPHGHGHNGHGHHTKRHTALKPRPLPERIHNQTKHRARVPAKCRQTYKTNQGRIDMFSKKCIERTAPRLATALPRNCSQRLWSSNGAIHGYSPTCLSRQGWLNRR